MPEFSRQTKLPDNTVGHRDRFSELGAVGSPIDDFIEEKVEVAVKPLRVDAREYQTRVAGAADVKIGRLPAVNAAEIADCNRGIEAFAPMYDSLHPQRYPALVVAGLTSEPGMSKRLVPHQKLQPRRNGQLHHLVHAGLRVHTRGIPCAQIAGLELQITNGSERGGRGHGGPPE